MYKNIQNKRISTFSSCMYDTHRKLWKVLVTHIDKRGILRFEYLYGLFDHCRTKISTNSTNLDKVINVWNVLRNLILIANSCPFHVLSLFLLILPCFCSMTDFSSFNSMHESQVITNFV